MMSTQKNNVKRINPAIENLSPALNSGGMLSIATLIAKKLEPFIIHSATRIIHIFDCCCKLNHLRK